MKTFDYKKVLPIFLIGLPFLLLTFTPKLLAQTDPYPMHWVNQVASSSWDFDHSAVATDNEGNCYLTGVFSGSTAAIQSVILNKIGGRDFFIAKFSPEGNLIWTRQVGAEGVFFNSLMGQWYSKGVTTDPNGNVLVTGSYDAPVTFGLGEDTQTELLSIGSTDIFIAKYDPDGNLIWAKRAGGNWWDQGLAITTDNTGACYLTGSLQGSPFNPQQVTFGIDESTPITLVINGYVNVFVAKYDVDGNIIWAKKVEGYTAVDCGGTHHYPGYDYSHGIAITSDNDCIITGEFNYGAYFGPGEPNETFLQASPTDACGDYENGNYEMFIAKYDGSDGFLMWAKCAQTSSLASGWSIAIDAYNNSLVTGFFVGSSTFGTGEGNETTLVSSSDDIFIAKYLPNGELTWARKEGGNYVDWGYGIATDPYNNFFVTGETSGTATFGAGQDNETIINSEGQGDIFVAKYDSDGLLYWVKREGGADDDVGHGIALDNSGNIFVNGSFRNLVTFAPGETYETTLTSSQSSSGGYVYDFFLMKREAPQQDVIMVDFDIHPTSWPNPLNVMGGGVVPCAILGTETFDATTVDPSTLLLEGVAPLGWSWEDVTGPANGESECNDTEQGPDGYIDLTIKFDKQELIAALGEVNDEDELILTITGNLMEEQEIEGNDCIFIIDKSKAAEAESTKVPLAFDLGQNYPNPFNSNSTICFSIPEDCHVQLEMLDMTGKQLSIISNQEYKAGNYSVELKALDLEQGIYFYRMSAAGWSKTKQLIIIK